jgi:glycerophosphoryl diester phosphodiesterase
MRKPLVHGHRGCRAVRPENTLAAFEHALKVGVDALEMDVCVTDDDVLVASHDPTLNPVICRGPGGAAIEPQIAIRSLRYAELARYDCGSARNPDYPHQVLTPGLRIPRLDEVLRMGASSKAWFNIETKMRERPDLAPSPERFAELVLQAVRRHGVESRTILQSFDYRSLRAMKRLAPKMPLAALDDIGKQDWLTLARQAEATIISPRHDFVTSQKVRAAHAAGLEVVAWTANRPEQWRRVVDAGVDAIITDDPEALIAWLAVRRLR